MHLLEVKNLHVEVDGKKILNGLELSIGKGLTAVIAFVRCARAELPPREDLTARAARELL